MGIIKATFNAIGGGLADQWLEVIEPEVMGDTTVMAQGVKVRRNDKRNSNKKGTDNTVSNGSIIQVYPNQFMMLVDGGKIVDYTAEEGYYKVENSSLPSLFNGQFGDALKETFSRIKFSGVTPTAQKVYYINLKEIKGIKFGTPNPVNYFDNFYNAELFLRAFGTYSIKIVNPLKFFTEVLSYSSKSVDINDINEQYLSEFLSAFQAAINQMSADNIKISYVASKSAELNKYMSTILDEDWTNMRGMLIQSVGIASISYDDESKRLLNMRNEGALLGDPSVREGYIQGSIARGIEAAGSNAGGAMGGFLGVGLGLNQSGGFMSSATSTNAQQIEQQKANQDKIPNGSWKCICGVMTTGKFCTECGAQRQNSSEWICDCGTKNTSNFCNECGAKRPVKKNYRCNKCGYIPEGNVPKFCPECGDAFNDDDMI